MKQLEMYDPRNPLAGQQLLRVFKEPLEQGQDYFFIRNDEHLLIYREQLHTFPPNAIGGRAGTTKLFRYQFTIPLLGIRWFIDVIEQKFFKSPHEGGLPAHKLRNALNNTLALHPSWKVVI